MRLIANMLVNSVTAILFEYICAKVASIKRSIIITVNILSHLIYFHTTEIEVDVERASFHHCIKSGPM